jgi:hypothetical protein
LGEYLASETGKIGNLAAAVCAGYALATDDIECPGDNAMLVGEGVVAGIFVKQTRNESGAEVGSVGFV